MEKLIPPAVRRRRRLAAVYVRWEKVCVVGEKGRREFRYFLKRSDGVSDLAVVGKEGENERKKRVSYRFSSRIRNLFVDDGFVDNAKKKLKSRRKVVACLDNVVAGSQTHRLPHSHDLLLDRTSAFKGIKLGYCVREFSWLGSPWMCRKKRMHYQSFCRNGVRISVHDFVYVLSEEEKRLVAYLEDMYEDCRGNKMVEVRWFHRIDEVCIVLCHSSNDNEVFFSSSLQDISVECIDGLATVLSPQHYEKYLTDAMHVELESFICCSEFLNGNIKPFDITNVKGYWNQEILRYMYIISPLKSLSTCQPSGDGLRVIGDGDGSGVLPRKRLRCFKNDKVSFQYTMKKYSTDSKCMNGLTFSDCEVGCKRGSEICNGREHSSPGLSSKKEAEQNSPPTKCLAVGSQVEVLSQDSGLRGCWFKASILSKHNDKVKVRYQDIQDPDDEAKKLEEWVLASRVAVPDEYCLRVTERMTIRPSRNLVKGSNSWAIDVGAVVDVWWCDGWWEGIVVQKRSEARVHVYFPGENKKSIFCSSDMRHSQEWLGNGWKDVTPRPDLVTLLLSGSGVKLVELKYGQEGLTSDADNQSTETCADVSGSGQPQLDARNAKENDVVVGPDLFKNIIPQWKTSRKRRRIYGGSVQEMQDADKGSGSDIGSVGPRDFLVQKSLKVDHDNCKLVGDSVLSSSSVPPLTSLVMSR